MTDAQNFPGNRPINFIFTAFWKVKSGDYYNAIESNEKAYMSVVYEVLMIDEITVSLTSNWGQVPANETLFLDASKT